MVQLSVLIFIEQAPHLHPPWQPHQKMSPISNSGPLGGSSGCSWITFPPRSPEALQQAHGWVTSFPWGIQMWKWIQALRTSFKGLPGHPPFSHLVRLGEVWLWYPMLCSWSAPTTKQAPWGQAHRGFLPRRVHSESVCKMKDAQCLLLFWGKEKSHVVLSPVILSLSKQDHSLETGKQRLSPLLTLRTTLLCPRIQGASSNSNRG